MQLSNIRTIAIVSEKGGAGKTTLAVNLAVIAENSGRATVVFDLDPRANAAIWGDARGRCPEVVPAQASRLSMLLQQAQKAKADLILLDTPSNALHIAQVACGLADLILIPCRPYPPDLLSIVPTVKVALAAGIPTFVLINAAPAQGIETAEATAAIERAGVAVCPVILHQRKAFVSRFHEGMSATEVDFRCKAALELDELWAWVIDALGILPKGIPVVTNHKDNNATT